MLEAALDRVGPAATPERARCWPTWPPTAPTTATPTAARPLVDEALAIARRTATRPPSSTS